MFKIGNRVVSIKNASKIATVTDCGFLNRNGVQWIEVKSGNKKRWVLADGFREYSASRDVHVPDGIIVVVQKGHSPEFFQLPESKATEKEIVEFVSAIQRMYLQRM